MQPIYSDTLFSTYYKQRVTLFRALPHTNDDIIFLGNSITDGGEWSELFADLKIKNRGISGDNTVGILNRLDEIYNRNPAKVFLLIGTNDLARNVSPDSVAKNIFWIAQLLKEKVPTTKLYIQSIFPVNEKFGMFKGHASKTKEIMETNKLIWQHSLQYGYNYIDVFSSLIDSSGRLDEKNTNDGLHLTAKGYLKWKEAIYTDVYDLPSLIPLPQKINWVNQKVTLSNFKLIVSESPLFNTESYLIKQLFEKYNVKLGLSNKSASNKNRILLQLDYDIDNNEGYQLSVRRDEIIIKAKASAGVFYAIQTLRQLIKNDNIQCAEIVDSPAFPIRGFMVDVGRNYQSIRQLKQQIDVMATYKLNLFHFHLTEDIAWRLQCKTYPQLTDAKFMLRNPGKFYSIKEMKDLITYCKQRHITLVPEIDMPGHSGAFKRAMGVDMQSEEGITFCKIILSELCKEFDVPYIHIGGDEVRITNKDFLPDMVALLKSKGKKVIAWQPGGNTPEGTIQQMWVGDTKPKLNYFSLDSRHLYLNHFDPLDGVVTTYNHQICDTPKSDENKQGAILCNWPDRKVNNEEDLINMNAVYPVMLTFAERCWQGGGLINFKSDIGSFGSEQFNSFTKFENRLLEHKSQNFSNHSFPYVKVSNKEWKLIGPFNNYGQTDSVFPPESNFFLDTMQLKIYPSVYGGTIWLRHFWFPMIGSHLDEQQDSSTYYATRKIWSEEDGVKNFWVGFNNISRSTATNSPPEGAWDNKGSCLWVNGQLIEPPQWKHGGQKGDSEIPLIDEGYEYREPTKIFVQKGWNTVLLKLPVGSFKGEWQNPVKWMFTFVELF